MNKIKSLVIGFIVLLVLLGSFEIINTGNVGVIYRLGEVRRVIEPGLNFKVPFLESAKEIDTKISKETVRATAASKDLQNVSAEVAINYSVDGKNVLPLVRTIGYDFKIRVIDPAIQEAIKATTAVFTAEELVTKRAEVRDMMLAALQQRLAKDFILISDVSITDLDFSDSFNAAIENKVKAEQEALTAKNNLATKEFEAKQVVVAAEAEAEAIRIKTEAVNSQGGQAYVQLQIANKWNGVLPTTMVPGSALPFLNVK